MPTKSPIKRKSKTNEPLRLKDGTFSFPDYPEFRPNLSPREVFKMGSFGGTYWRPIYSSVTEKNTETNILSIQNRGGKEFQKTILLENGMITINLLIDTVSNVAPH